MANVYTTETAITARIGAARLLAVLDRNADGTADTGVLTAAIERSGRIINRRLRQRYGSSVPFAQITGTPATPEEIQKIAEDLVLWDLYSYFEPSGRDAEYHHALGHDALEALRKGEDDIDVSRADAHEGMVIAVYEAEAPTFAGLDSDDVARDRGI
jgi:hypothetical protein